MNLSRSSLPALLLALVLAPLSVAAAPQEPAPAPPPPGELVDEEWQLISMGGAPIGHGSQLVYRFEEDGEERFLSIQQAQFRIGRLGAETEFSIETSMTEDGAGKILRASGETRFAQNPTRVEGEVAGGWFRGRSVLMGRAEKVEFEWDDAALSWRGLEELSRLLVAEGEGATASVVLFDPTLARLTNAELEVGPREAIDYRGESVECQVLWSESDQMPGMRSQSWIGPGGDTLRTVVPALGGIEMAFEVLPREEVLAAVAGAGPADDLFARSVIECTPRIPRPRSLDEAVYRLRWAGDPADLAVFAAVANQELLDDSDDVRSLRVRRSRPVAPPRLPLADLPADVAAYLAPDAMIQSDLPELVAAARAAVGAETDAWAAAGLLEQWVYRHIDKKGMDLAMASAAEIFAERSGDCTEHAVLLTAMCRAAGIPARVVMGFEYFSGVFGGHAWTEVWAGGWHALDATNGFGSADATHLAAVIGMPGEETRLADFAALARLMGALEIEVRSLRYGERSVEIEAGESSVQIDGGRYRDDVLRLAFAVPTGWDLEAGDPRGITGEICEIEAPHGPDQFEIEAHEVPYSFTLQELVDRGAADDGAPPVSCELAGFPALRFEEARGEGRGRTRVFVLSGDTLFGFELRWSQPESRAAFETFLTSVELGGAM